LGTRLTLLVISLFCLITAGGALASLALKNELCAVVSALGVIGVMIAGRIFGHGELGLLFKRLADLGSSLANFPTSNHGRGYEVHLQGSLDWGALWHDLHCRFEKLSLKSVQLDVNVPAMHENYHASWNQPTPDDGNDTNTWRADFPLNVHGRIFGRLSVAGRGDGAPEWKKIEVLARLSEEFAAGNHLFNGVAIDPPHPGGITPPIRTAFHEPNPVAAASD
jgi:UDP-GlcNAc:undecaprenyl-phosphate GlcNAc-1-phosphate transferase